jgi:hypothetical protein
MKMQVRLKFFKETPGSVNYREVDPSTNIPYLTPNAPNCKIGALYIRKREITPLLKPGTQKGWPQLLLLTIESGDQPPSYQDFTPKAQASS